MTDKSVRGFKYKIYTGWVHSWTLACLERKDKLSPREHGNIIKTYPMPKTAILPFKNFLVEFIYAETQSFS